MTTRNVDYYDLDASLTDEERLVRNNVRQFVDREVLPDIGERYDRGEFPMHIVPKMGEMGLFGPHGRSADARRTQGRLREAAPPALTDSRRAIVLRSWDRDHPLQRDAGRLDPGAARQRFSAVALGHGPYPRRAW